jgi:hypothetical protein
MVFDGISVIIYVGKLGDISLDLKKCRHKKYTTKLVS